MKIIKQYNLVENGADVVAISLAGNVMIKMNTITAFVWGKFITDSSVEDVVTSTALEFNIDKEKAREIVKGFIEIMSKNNLWAD